MNINLRSVIVSKKLLISILVMLLCMPYFAMSQTALINVGSNSGRNLIVKGEGNPLPQNRIALIVLGDFENQVDAAGNNGIIDLVDNGHMYVTGNWTNNSFSNVFSLGSTSKTDGIVTLKNNFTNQIIGGLTATFFENLYVHGSRKILVNEINSVNQTLLVNAPFILNSRTFEIKNPDPSGINYLSGFIKSETLPGNHGFIKWNTGNYVGTFTIPFGSDGASANNDLNLSLKTNGPMAMADYFNFATYPTDPFNQPMPTGATPLEFEIRKVADRYWVIDPRDKNNLASLDLTFSYDSDDISDISNSINPDRLVATRNNTTLAKWLDMEPRGTHYINTVEITNVLPSDFYSTWTLVNMPPVLTDLFAPDAFSPDGDGLNDLFIPIFQADFEVIDYELIIFNRWGKVVFRTKDRNQGWNGIPIGTNKEPLIDVYSWIVFVKGRTYGDVDAEGRKNKYTGRVTLIL